MKMMMIKQVILDMLRQPTSTPRWWYNIVAVVIECLYVRRRRRANECVRACVSVLFILWNLTYRSPSSSCFVSVFD